jgi:RNA 2',3'-cyclic 3'-phosphodiesterase
VDFERGGIMRAFVAIDLSDPVAPGEDVGAATAPSHLTLRFLGEVAEDREPSIAAALAEAVRPLSPFVVTFEGVDAFPSRRAPRVVWVGAAAGRAPLVALALRVSDALAAVGFPPETTAFVPHVTLFRVRSPRDRQRARLLLDGTLPPPAPRTVRVTEVVLKQSTLTQHGAVHATRGRFPLAGAAVPPP